MNKLKEVVYYLLYYYPYADELSKTRTTKMVYLADWFSAIKYKSQITEIEWYYDHFGPYVDDIYDAALHDNEILIEQSFSYFGNRKEIFRLKEDFIPVFELLNNHNMTILNTVIEETKYLNWNEFIKLIYSTYPIEANKKYTYLNLVELAEDKI
ncbi:Panacea domain-containing protein [Lysinibacillus sp. FSL W8-0953]|uniref:Panacea domain-containing protein n=1 Tax=Lysinibacillus sp. FSL W8-0953 TaxID=2954640 RepID=UPI0030F8E5B4